MTAKPHATSATAGFSLVELLVAVTLVALLTVALFGGLRFATRSADAVGRRIDHGAQIAVAYDFMQNELAGAVALPAAPRSPDAAIDFTGEPDAVSFVVQPPTYLALGGLHWLHVALEGEGAGRRLVVSWQPVQRGPVATPAATLRPSILLEGVKSVAFAYFGVQDRSGPPAWSGRWTDRRALPQLVRLRIALADGWKAPDLIVAPRLSGSAQP